MVSYQMLCKELFIKEVIFFSRAEKEEFLKQQTKIYRRKKIRIFEFYTLEHLIFSKK